LFSKFVLRLPRVCHTPLGGGFLNGQPNNDWVAVCPLSGGVPNRKAIRVIATMRNGNDYQILVSKTQDGDGLNAPYPRHIPRTRTAPHFLKVLFCAAGVELVKRPPQLLRGDRYA
jgi:hypothetical protein